MKNLILTIALFFAFMTFTFSQSSLILGVEGGGNLSKVKYTGDFSTSNQSYSRTFGYEGGIKIGVKFGGFSILSGVSYNKLGGKDKVERNDASNPFIFQDFADIGTRTTTFSYNTLKFPIHLRYEFGDKIKFSIAAGASIHKGIGEAVDVINYNLTVNGQKGPFEYKYSYGDIGKDLMKKSFVAFHISPGVMYELNDNGLLTFNVAFESAGDIRNENYVILDQGGSVFQPAGSIKMNSMMFQIGYEHRLNFNVGSKY